MPFLYKNPHDIAVTVSPSLSHPGRLDLITEGFYRSDRPELSIRGVPEQLSICASMILEIVAPYVRDNDVKVGEHVGFEFDDGPLVVRVVEEFPRIWRLVDANTDALDVPWLALADSSLLRAKALTTATEDDVQARTFLEAVLPLFPTPNRPELQTHLPVNWNCARTHLYLAQTESNGITRRNHLREAVERSRVVAEELLGESPSVLKNVSEDEVARHARLIVSKYTEFEMTDNDGLNTPYVSPIWYVSEGGSELSLTILPRDLIVGYLDALASLDIDLLVSGLLEVWNAHRHHPANLVPIVFETQNHFDTTGAPTFPLDVRYVATDYVLSSLFGTALRLLLKFELPGVIEMMKASDQSLWEALDAIESDESMMKMLSLFDAESI